MGAETAAITTPRCVPASPAQRQMLQRPVAAPSSKGLTRKQWQVATDRLRASDEAKGRTGIQLANELDRCAR